MCDQCVAEGAMTQQQADAQRAALDAGDIPEFLAPILDMLQNGRPDDRAKRYEDGVDNVIEAVTELAKLHLADHEDTPVYASADKLAAQFMYQLDHKQQSRLLAEISIRFAQQKATEPDDDLADQDPVTAAAVRLADEADESVTDARDFLENLVNSGSLAGKVGIVRVDSRDVPADDQPPAPGLYL